MKRANAMLSAINFHDSQNLFSDLLNEQYALIKGEALSIQCYNSVGKRSSGDIDLLIPIDRLDKVQSILSKNGFEKISSSREKNIFMASNSHQTLPWIKKNAVVPIIVDLNLDLFWGEYDGPRININDFLYDTKFIDIYECKVKVLSPIKALIQLILHHYKDMNSIYLLATRNSIRYEMFYDIYNLIMNNMNIKVNNLLQLSEEYNITHFVYYVLYHVGMIFNNDVINKYIDSFKTQQGIDLLNCYGLSQNERHEWKCDFKTRLQSDNLFALIKNDLTEKDIEKIAINQKIFSNFSHEKYK